MTSEFDDDTLNRLLPSTDAPDSGLREAILHRTRGVVRRRLYVRRVGYALALAGCYLAGILTMSLATPQAPAVVQQVQPAPADNHAPPPAPHPQKIAVEKPVENKRPTIARVRPTRFEKLRQAADRALVEQDMIAAVKLYKKALDVAKPEELAISVERDNWLLISLKEARLQEKQNAKQG
jgi:hypothetical protein